MAGRTPRLRARRHGLIGRNLPRPWAERIMEAAISASGDEEEARRRDINCVMRLLRRERIVRNQLRKRRGGLLALTERSTSRCDTRR